MIESRRILGRRQDLWGGTFITIARRQLSHQLPRFLSSSTPPPDSNLHLSSRETHSLFLPFIPDKRNYSFLEALKRPILFPHLDVSSCPSTLASSDWHAPRIIPHRPGLPLFLLRIFPAWSICCLGRDSLDCNCGNSWALHPAISSRSSPTFHFATAKHCNPLRISSELTRPLR